MIFVDIFAWTSLALLALLIVVILWVIGVMLGLGPRIALGLAIGIPALVAAATWATLHLSGYYN